MLSNNGALDYYFQSINDIRRLIDGIDLFWILVVSKEETTSKEHARQILVKGDHKFFLSFLYHKKSKNLKSFCILSFIPGKLTKIMLYKEIQPFNSKMRKMAHT